MRKYLKDLRNSKGLTQLNMAEKLGTTQQYYNMIENRCRKKKLDIEIATRLAKIFNVSLDYVVEQEKKLGT